MLAFCWVTDLMPSTLREIQKPGLPHCSRRFVCYTTRADRVQGDVYGVGAALPMVSACLRMRRFSAKTPGAKPRCRAQSAIIFALVFSHPSSLHPSAP